MKLSTHKKPNVNLDLLPLCDFRSGKGYLWSLIQTDYLLFRIFDPPVHILDAACHALITRNMFPQGVFIISGYLHVTSKKAHSIKSPTMFFIVQTTRPLNLDSAFDVVVIVIRCRIFLYLNVICPDNILQSLKKGGDILVNFSLELVSWRRQYLCLTNLR